jgi:hypothetical protein
MANVKDGATSLVATAPSPATSGTSLVVTTGEGTVFPTPPFYAIVHPVGTLPTVAVAEKVLVTAISTDTLTITRAQGIYTAKTVLVGWRISNAIFQEDMNNSSIIQNETPGGTVNGVTTAFTVASATGMLTGSLKVYKNGVRMKGGGADFTQTATGFTMVTAPATGTVLLCDYNVNGALNNVGTNSILSDEVPTGLVNGSNATFTLARAYIAGSVEVYINGVKQARGTHFTETTPASGIFTMGDAPLTGDIITCNYQFNLNPASNADTVDGIHASSTPVANQLLALDSNAFVPTAALGGAWSTWTPTFTNLTIGNGTVTARFYRVGNLIHYRLKVVWGSTTSIPSGGVTYTLPTATRSDYITGTVLSGYAHNLGQVALKDDSAGNIYVGLSLLITTTTATIDINNSAGTYLTGNAISAAVPISWTINDSMAVEGYYEAA